MRHCPTCLTLFADHAQRCPDCGVELAKGSPPVSRDRKRDCALVCVFRAQNVFEAQRVAGALEESGVRAVIIEQREGAFGGDIAPLFHNALAGGHWGEVCVLDLHVPRAAALIDELLSADCTEGAEELAGPESD